MKIQIHLVDQKEPIEIETNFDSMGRIIELIEEEKEYVKFQKKGKTGLNYYDYAINKKNIVYIREVPNPHGHSLKNEDKSHITF